MKKTISFLTILFLTISINAQTEKGNWMFGGDAIIQGYKFENQDKFIYYAEIFPKAGYFIKDQFVIGSEIGVFINEATFYTSLVPFARFYLYNNEKILNPFIEGGIGFKNTSYKGKSSGDPAVNDFIYQFKIGTSVFFTNSVALNLTLNYKKNSFQFNEELSIAFGFQIHLQKK
ncbi:hypothetical protein [Polaribacter sp. R77954]|uniref:hypothetical protein n=1 Tax=Polaribacter sp. R77954 TaxID=3093870 RepID=UPI0037C87E0D